MKAEEQIACGECQDTASQNGPSFENTQRCGLLRASRVSAVLAFQPSHSTLQATHPEKKHLKNQTGLLEVETCPGTRRQQHGCGEQAGQDGKSSLPLPQTQRPLR